MTNTRLRLEKDKPPAGAVGPGAAPESGPGHAGHHGGALQPGGWGGRAQSWLPHPPWRRYALSTLLVAAVTLVGIPLQLVISPTNVVMLYLAAVVYAAVTMGRGPSILASVLGVLAFDLFFVPPHFTLAVSDTEYLVTFVGLFVVGLVVSSLAAQAREQAEAARRQAEQTTQLFHLSRDLAAAPGVDELLQVVLRHVGQAFGRKGAILLPQAGRLETRLASPGFVLLPNELAAAGAAYQRAAPVGLHTTHMPAAAVSCLPLMAPGRVVGVLALRGPADGSQPQAAEQGQLLDAFATQAALAIERAQLADQARQALLLKATEKLQTALLNSISHDLRTPLVSITGALSSLQEDQAVLDEDARRALVDNAREEAERLNQLVGNLLDMSRIEGGVMTVKREVVDMTDLVSTTLQQMQPRLAGRAVRLEAPPDLPLAPLDFVLMARVLVNLVDNALKYSPPGSPIDVRLQKAGSVVRIEVADRGIGIPPEDLRRVFDKFYRAQRMRGAGGTGLGLSICKGIVEAHGGQIRAEAREGGGTCLIIEMPAIPGSDPAGARSVAQ